MSLSVRQVQSGDRNINQLQENIRQALEPVFNESSGTFVGDCSGFVEMPSININWQTGTTQNAVTLSFPAFTATSNSTSFFISGLPKILYPQSDQICLFRTYDNGTIGIGLIDIGPNGTIAFSKDISAASFTASGLKGIGAGCVTYIRGI